jgi:hypothetical protein
MSEPDSGEAGCVILVENSNFWKLSLLQREHKIWYASADRPAQGGGASMSAPLKIIADALGSEADAIRLLAALRVSGWICAPLKAIPAMLDAAYEAAHAENAAGVWEEMINVLIKQQGEEIPAR